MVSDVVMPGLSGTELASRLTRKNPRMKVLFVSGYIDDAP
jgi:FixJ family two-component response regulator